MKRYNHFAALYGYGGALGVTNSVLKLQKQGKYDYNDPLDAQ